MRIWLKISRVIIACKLAWKLIFARNSTDIPIEEIKKRADKGDPEAQNKLGFAYRNGKGVAQDHSEAVRWYRLAAKQGLAKAQFNLALAYDKGKGVPQNDNEAVRWYRIAAEQGDADSQNNLGIMYDDGRGVPRNCVFAYMWYNLAAAQGNLGGKANRDNLAKIEMTRKQIGKAQKLSAEMFDKINKKK